VLVTSFTYAGLALWWAVAQFHSEEVLFREAERFDLRLWLKRLWTHKPAVPGPGGAICCLTIALLGQLLLMQPASRWLASLSDAGRPGAAIWLLIWQQIFLILTPALLLGAVLLTDMRRTFRLRTASTTAVAIAVGLALALHPLVQELMQHLEWFFPPGLPEGSHQFLEQLLGPSQPAWLILLAIAITPAICEEVLFRGYVLSSLDRPGRHRAAIVLSSMAFGAIHMIPQQVFYATLLGLILGTLALRTGSLWPCLAFHATFNTIAVVRERLAISSEIPGSLDWILSIDETGSLRYDWPLLAIAAASLLLLLRAVPTRQPPV
ncbi:MAG: type II CAAX endopeptidase family protein, partial [Planctomycetaceae bacterium]